MSQETMRFAVIGCGMIGFAHAAAIAALPSAELVTGVDVDPKQADAFAQRFGNGRILTSFDDVLDDEDVDVVVVATMNSLHADQTIRALQAGKHVIVQKPMAVTLEEADAMVRTAETSGCRLMTSFYQLFHPAVLRAGEIVRSGMLGDIFLIKAMMAWFNPDFTVWRYDPAVAGGGIVMDSHSHNLALTKWLMGDRQLQTVYGEMGALTTDVEVEDTAVLLLRYDRAIAEISGSSRVLEPNPQMNTWYKDTIEVFGTAGTLHIKPTERPSLRVYVEDASVPEPFSGGWIAPRLEWVPFEERGYSAHFNADEDPWVGLHRHFVDAVRNDAPFVSDGRFGRDVVAMAMAAYESSREGRPVKPAGDTTPLHQ